jgi:hypothetical protein
LIGISQYSQYSHYLLGISQYSQYSQYSHYYLELKTFLYSLVSDPKLLGAEGSSTALVGNVRRFKIFNFLIFFLNTAKLLAIALEKGPDKQNYCWMNFGQEKLNIFRNIFRFFLKILISKHDSDQCCDVSIKS